MQADEEGHVFYEDGWLSQKRGQGCFVWAVANYMLYFGYALPDLEEAKDIAKCRHGSTICHRETVEYFGADLRPSNYDLSVLDHGGILSIWHPLVNGHCFFVYPNDDRSVTLINSWLGPVKITALKEWMLKHTPETKGIRMDEHWVSISGLDV